MTEKIEKEDLVSYIFTYNVKEPLHPGYYSQNTPAMEDYKEKTKNYKTTKKESMYKLVNRIVSNGGIVDMNKNDLNALESSWREFYMLKAKLPASKLDKVANGDFKVTLGG